MRDERVFDYQILEEYTIGLLEHKVKTSIDDGWQPLGGLACTVIDNDDSCYTIYAQAMVRYPPNPEIKINAEAKSTQIWDK